MTVSRSYGDVVGHSLGIGASPSLRTKGLSSSPIAVSRLSIGREQIGLSPRIPAEDTYILAQYLTDLPHHELRSRDRPVLLRGYEAGAMRVVHLSGDYSARITHAHEALAFYLPRAALDEIAQELGRPRISMLDFPAGGVDPVLLHLSAALHPALRNPREASRLFVDHVLIAFVDHLIRRYGDVDENGRLPAKGGLSPYQTERAKEFLAAQCENDVSLAEAAAHCGMSRSHFAKAFRVTMGISPHRWRQRYRVDLAKDMLAGSDEPVAEIALACGFADQSHFTRVFSRIVGEGPAGWRRRQVCRLRQAS